MLDKEKHQLIMGQILKDIYSKEVISSSLGFKGGTCAWLFYDLPRFSVDLDFDFLVDDKLDISKQKVSILNEVESIIKKYGVVKDKYIKQNTIFLLLSYGEKQHNIKIEIQTRPLLPNLRNQYQLKKYLGASILVAKKDYMFGSKLVALTKRVNIAMRDVYDVYFFAKNNWDINEDIILSMTGKSLKQYLTNCINLISKIKENQILSGLGELLDVDQKSWVKSDLKKEVLFLLKLRRKIVV